MPMGPWPNFDACLADPAMLKRYPAMEQREKVCGAIKARLEAHDAAGPSRHTHGDLAGGSKITETADYWIVHDAVCAKEGVNDKAELKPWVELQASADTLEGAPIHYGLHPVDKATGKPSIPATFYDPRIRAVGHAINVRAQEADHTLRYDALLFKQRPLGYDTPTEDIAKNHATIELVRNGGSVENSGGYAIDQSRSRGAGLWKQDGAPIAYHEVQRGIIWGHVALLKPVGSNLGGSCGPACAVGVDEAVQARKSDEKHTCGEDPEMGCCRKRAATAALAIQAIAGGTTRAALLSVAAGDQPLAEKAIDIVKRAASKVRARKR